MPNHNLRIEVYDRWHGPCCFSQVKAWEDHFVLHLIVGHCELEVDRTFYSISFWRLLLDPTSTYPMIKRTIFPHIPGLLFLLFLLLIAALGRYWTSNSITHRTSHLPAFGLFIVFRSDLSVWTTMVCTSKYGLSFRATVISAKASFSIGGYFPSAPRSAQLV